MDKARLHIHGWVTTLKGNGHQGCTKPNYMILANSERETKNKYNDIGKKSYGKVQDCDQNISLGLRLMGKKQLRKGSWKNISKAPQPSILANKTMIQHTNIEMTGNITNQSPINERVMSGVQLDRSTDAGTAGNRRQN